MRPMMQRAGITPPVQTDPPVILTFNPTPRRVAGAYPNQKESTMTNKTYHLPAVAYRLGIELVDGLPVHHMSRDRNGNPRIAVCVSDVATWAGKNHGAVREALRIAGWRRKRDDGGWVWYKQTYNEEQTVSVLRAEIIRQARRVTRWQPYTHHHSAGRGAFEAEITADGTLGLIFWRGDFLNSSPRADKIRALLADLIAGEKA